MRDNLFTLIIKVEILFARAIKTARTSSVILSSFRYKSTNDSIMNVVLWLAALLAIYSVIDSEK